MKNVNNAMITMGMPMRYKGRIFTFDITRSDE